ncbi:MAG TPA: SAM-dependent methyltransferase [Pyrinomonadaceae bacterium]|nr:SAM-dependent methyltransferase [Pyrinomonadaceae bacterium]
MESLKCRIRRDGPITFRDWMQAALYDSSLGYYNRPDLIRWGRAGDYRTSPELSGLFAATFARFFASLFHQLGEPSHWTIVESGAGNGEFAAGVLDAFRTSHPSIFKATRYVIDEQSAAAGRLARERLATIGRKVEFYSIGETGNVNPGIFFSNELVDAFPVSLVTVENGELRELYVAMDPEMRFTFLPGPPSTQRLAEFLNENSIDLREGQIIEVNLQVSDWVSAVAEKLTAGYVITVDYGAEQEDLYGLPERFKGTLRAFNRHRFVEVLSDPGDNDITATVNWTQLRSVGEQAGLSCTSLTSLDQFLLREGLLEELQLRLDSSNSDVEKLKLTTQARDLILPTGMASHFQVMIQKRV